MDTLIRRVLTVRATWWHTLKAWWCEVRFFCADRWAFTRDAYLLRVRHRRASQVRGSPATAILWGEDAYGGRCFLKDEAREWVDEYCKGGVVLARDRTFWGHSFAGDVVILFERPNEAVAFQMRWR